ncbi:MAG: adenosylcobinamide-GDP ribazoletransferase [Lachnospiraceae bacterium]
MRIIKSMIIAFSMYSKIPMPQFAWKDEEMKYMLCFFPWVGAVIGGCVYLWQIVCEKFAVGMVCYTLIGMAIPLMITGGFHVDGFMDTMDAFHSYQEKEQKLNILKDSHIGAFAVITLGIYGLVYAGAFSEIKSREILKIVCAGFMLARVLSGIAVVSFPSAKENGLLYLFASKAQKNIVKAALYLQGIGCLLFMLWQSLIAGILTAAAAGGAFLYYYGRTKKELGGITGDTAGYFVLVAEGCMMVMAAVLEIVR